MFKEIIERLLAFPQRGEMQIDFDLKRKVFHLSIPIFSSPSASVKKYVEARKDSTFKPHTTSFHIKGEKVCLRQEVPFSSDFQATLRKQADEFWQMSRHCHRMLSEIAIEEKYKPALYLDTQF